MEEWKTYKLGDLIKIKYGKDHKSLADGNYPAYGSGGVMRMVERPIYDKPSILIPRKGSLNNFIYTEKPFWTVDTMFWTIIDTKLVLPHYLYYTIKDVDFASLNVGSAVPSLTCPIIEAIEVSIPSIETQKMILNCIEPLDSKIELNNRINHNLEEQAQALYKSWFVDFEPFKDGKFIESELGMIPEGWSTSTIQALSDRIASGGTPKSTDASFYDGPVKWFTTKELKDGFLFDSEKHISKIAVESSAAKVFPMGTVLMAIYASPTVGRLGILTSDSTFNQASVAILPKHNIGSEYIFLHLLSERDRLNNLASGAAQQNLNVGIVKNYPVLYPTLDVLISFNNIIKQIFSEIRNNSSENCRLTKMRDSLLSKLMSGELKINEIDC